MKKIFLVISSLLILGSCSTTLTSSVSSKLVVNVDLKRYSGLWYQVGRYPHFFQSDDCSESTAEYSLLENGRIEVLNRCWIDYYGGEYSSEVRATGTPVDEKGNWLKVVFYGLFPADYLIIELDRENYSWAAVTTPSEETLWILSRETSLPEEVYSAIVSSLERKGFDKTRIIKTSGQR